MQLALHCTLSARLARPFSQAADLQAAPAHVSPRKSTLCVKSKSPPPALLFLLGFLAIYTQSRLPTKNDTMDTNLHVTNADASLDTGAVVVAFPQFGRRFWEAMCPFRFGNNAAQLPRVAVLGSAAASNNKIEPVNSSLRAAPFVPR